MGNRNFRILRSRDTFLLTTLQQTCLPSDHPLDPSQGDWWVVWEGKEPVGFASLKPTAADPTWGYLARAGVVPAARGNGLQKRLIVVRESRARKLGMTTMVTDTANFNVASSNSLISRGYRLYRPARVWGFNDGNYWKKELT